MLSDKLKTGFASGKQQKGNIKLFAIAGILLLVFVGLLFWLFSGTSKNSKGIVPVNLESQTQNTYASSEPISSPIDEKVAQSILDSNSNTSSGQTPPSSILQDNENNIIEANNQPSGSSFPAGAVENIWPIQTPPTLVSNPKTLKISDAKEYLNNIKKDIAIDKGGLFYYQGKIYKKGDFLNAIYIVDVGDFYIRFAADNWEYSLRFLGSSK